MRRLTILVALAALAALALPATAPAAKYNVAVGIGDQNPFMFENPNFAPLKVKKSRYFIDWNVTTNPRELADADRFMAAARKARVRVLLHISTDDLREKKGKLPSVSLYRKRVGAIVKRYRARAYGVKDFGAWNEVNHKTQPTWNNPRRAGQYFLEMRKMLRSCRTCKLVGLDVLDQRGVDRYMARFYKALGSKKRLVKVVGIHSYSDTNRAALTNRYRDSGTKKIIAAGKKGNRRSEFWMTETGGLAEFGRSFPCDLQRQAEATNYMFKIAIKQRRSIKRLYSYNWTGSDCATRFDAGLTGADGHPRPAYFTFQRNLRSFAR